MTRKELKQESKLCIKENKGEVIKSTLLYTLLPLIPLFIPLLFGIDFSKLISEATTLPIPTNELVYKSVFNSVPLPGVVAIAILCLLLSYVLTGILHYAYANSFKNMLLEESREGIYKDAFSSIHKIVGLQIVIFLKLMLWSLLLFIPAICVAAMSAYLPDYSLLTKIIGVILIVICIIFITRASLRYSQAVFFLQEENGPIKSIRLSKEMMKGKIGNYFVLGLSFIGIILLLLLPSTALEILSTYLLNINMKIPSIISLIVAGLLSFIVINYLTAYIQMTVSNWHLDNRNDLEEVEDETYSIEDEDNTSKTYNETNSNTSAEDVIIADQTDTNKADTVNSNNVDTVSNENLLQNNEEKLANEEISELETPEDKADNEEIIKTQPNRFIQENDVSNVGEMNVVWAETGQGKEVYTTDSLTDGNEDNNGKKEVEPQKEEMDATYTADEILEAISEEEKGGEVIEPTHIDKKNNELDDEYDIYLADIIDYVYGKDGADS